jgi:cytochrome c553
MPVRLPRGRSLFVWAGATALLLGAGGFLFAWSGIYNIAASAGHLSITSALLKFGLHSSVRTHSRNVDPPPLDDDALVRLGAAHFDGGCAPCHGAPGESGNPINRTMLPPPPPLSDRVGVWETNELYWIVRHGIKYTGMPAWPGLPRGDDVWPVVAFLRALPGMSPADYRRLSNAPDESDKAAGDNLLEALPLCVRCHGDRDSPTISRHVPRLDGLTSEYMASALRDYSQGHRFSGIMEPVASALDQSEIARLTDYYSGLGRNRALERFSAQETALVEEGRRVATQGVPAEGIPPCMACHGSSASDLFPRLEGQHAPYTMTQLRLWKSGSRGTTVAGEIMEPIARRMSEEQIRAVAAYFAGQSGSGANGAGRNASASGSSGEAQ